MRWLKKVEISGFSAIQGEAVISVCFIDIYRKERYNSQCITMLNSLVLRLYFPYRKKGRFQAGAKRLAVACWSRETLKKRTVLRHDSPCRMAELSVFEKLTYNKPEPLQSNGKRRRILNKQQPWTIGRIIYAFLMSFLLLGYLAVIAAYSDPTTTGKTFYFPGFVWILRIITGVMAIYLGKLWKDKGFWILVVFLLLKLTRVMADDSHNVFNETVSDALLTGFWVFSACYGLARVFDRKQMKCLLNIYAVIWTLGMIVYSSLGIYAAWTGGYISTIGDGAAWYMPRHRVFLVYYPTVAGSVLSFGALLAVCGVVTAKRKAVKILFLLSLIPMLVALCLTDSRCAQVTVSAGIATITGFYVLRALREYARKKEKSGWYAWVTAFVVTGVVFAAFVLLCMNTITVFNKIRADGLLIPRALAEGAKAKPVVSNRGFTGDNVLTNRPMIWKAALKVLISNPTLLLWGTSVLNSMTLVNAVKSMTLVANHCHCMPLMILLENGIPGILLTGAFLVKAAAASFRLVLKADRKRDILPVAIAISILTGELVECFTWLRAGQCPTLPFFFVVMGIIMATGQKPGKETVMEIQSNPVSYASWQA